LNQAESCQRDRPQETLHGVSSIDATSFMEEIGAHAGENIMPSSRGCYAHRSLQCRYKMAAEL